MSQEPTVIYSAANTQQAYLLKGLLADRGIVARVVNDAIQMAGGELPMGWTAAARVVVAENDALVARQVAEEFDRQTAHHAPIQEAMEEGEQALADVPTEWDQWPVCPACGERRSARCPVCGVSGSKFALADIQETTSGERALLFCGACDDHFLPEWHRLCPRCGHDYGDGLVVDRRLPAADASTRAWIVIALLIAAGLMAGAYFCWLFGWRTG